MSEGERTLRRDAVMPFVIVHVPNNESERIECKDLPFGLRASKRTALLKRVTASRKIATGQAKSNFAMPGLVVTA